MADSLKTYKIELNVDTAKGIAEVTNLIKTLNDTGVPLDKITKSVDKFGKASISVLTRAVTEAQAANLGFSTLSHTLSGLSKLTIGDNISGKLKEQAAAQKAAHAKMLADALAMNKKFDALAREQMTQKSSLFSNVTTERELRRLAQLRIDEATRTNQQIKALQLKAAEEERRITHQTLQAIKAEREKYLAGSQPLGQTIKNVSKIQAADTSSRTALQVQLAADTKALKDAELVHKQTGERIYQQYLRDNAALREAHKRRGEDLMQAYTKSAAEAKEIHRRRGEIIAQQYLRDNEAVKAALKAQEEAHKRQGEVLMAQWRSQGEAHTRLGEILMRNYLKDAAAAKEAHRRKGELIAQEYARQNAADKAAEQTRLSQFSQFLHQREALLQADINRQRHIEISGINSIEAHRADAQRARLVAEQAYRNRIAIIESSVKGGTSSSVGQTQATAAMQHYLSVLKQVDSQLATHEHALKKTEVAHKAMWLRVIEVTAVYRVWMTAIQYGQQALLSIPTTGIHFEGTKAGLQAVSGTASGAYREMAFLNHEAKRTGMALDGLRSSFRLFAASAISSGEDMKTVEGIFANVNTMATTLHLSTNDVNGIFLALGQTFNKGKLQSEELVKQLAQRVPGSVTLMAKAYRRLGEEAGKSGETVQQATQRLLHDMKTGSVAAHGNIEALANEMALMFGGEAFKHASTGLNAAIGRLDTSWTHLTENIYKASASSMMSVLGFTSTSIESLSAMSDDTLALETSFNTVGHTVRNFFAFMAGGLSVFGIYKIAISQVVGMFGFWTTVWLRLNTAIMASPIGIITALSASLATLAARFDAIGEKRAALEKLAFAPEERPKTAAEEFNYKVDQDPRVKELNFAIEAGKKNIEKFSATLFGKLIAPDELKRAQEVQSALVDKMFLKRREVTAELKKQANLGNVTDESTLQETAYDISSRRNAKLSKEVDDRISTLQKKKQLEIDSLNTKAKIQEDRTGKIVDSAKLEHDTLAVEKKYREQINALIREKSGLTEEGERKTLEGASKSITAFDKLVTIMRTMESRGRIDAVSPVGAVGKHQVMPSTLAHGNYGDRVQGIPEAELQRAISYEQVGRRTRRMSPEMYAYLRQFATKYSDKIADFGVNELRKNFEHFGGDASKALAAYNAGRGTIEKLSRSRGDNWVSGLPAETRNYVREGIRLGAPKAAGELDKYEGQRSSIKAQMEEQDILSQKQALQAEAIAAQREKALRLEKEKAAEQAVKNTLANEELQMETDSFKQNQLAADLAKITYEFDKKKAELEKNGNFAGIEILKVKTTQLRVQATLAEAERKVAQDSEFAALAEKDLMLKKTTGLLTERAYQTELVKIKESQIPNLEAELKLTEEITKEEDKRLAVAKIQAQIAELRKETAMSLDQPSAAGDYINQVSSAKDSTDTRGYNERRDKLDAGRVDELNSLTPVGQNDRDGELQSLETFLQQRNALEAKYADANFLNQTNYYAGIAAVGADTFQGITGHMIKMYGAQSKQAKIAFVAYKAFMVAQTIMNTAAAVVAQLANPTPYVGIALAAMAAATGAIQVAKIISEPMPQAHGGLEYVPQDATYKLSKGERVLAPKQNEAFMKLNRDLSAQMQRDGQKTGKTDSTVSPTVVKPRFKVVNIDYSSQDLTNQLQSAEGEEIIVNHMKRNRESLV